MKVNEKPKTYDVKLDKGAVVNGKKCKKGDTVTVGRNLALVLVNNKRGHVTSKVDKEDPADKKLAG